MSDSPALSAILLLLGSAPIVGLLALKEAAAVLDLIALLGALAQSGALFRGELVNAALASVGALDRAAAVATRVLGYLPGFRAFGVAELSVAVLVEALQGADEVLALLLASATLLVAGAAVAATLAGRITSRPSSPVYPLRLAT